MRAVFEKLGNFYFKSGHTVGAVKKVVIVVQGKLLIPLLTLLAVDYLGHLRTNNVMADKPNRIA